MALAHTHIVYSTEHITSPSICKYGGSTPHIHIEYYLLSRALLSFPLKLYIRIEMNLKHLRRRDGSLYIEICPRGNLEKAKSLKNRISQP